MFTRREATWFGISCAVVVAAWIGATFWFLPQFDYDTGVRALDWLIAFVTIGVGVGVFGWVLYMVGSLLFWSAYEVVRKSVRARRIHEASKGNFDGWGHRVYRDREGVTHYTNVYRSLRIYEIGTVYVFPRGQVTVYGWETWRGELVLCGKGGWPLKGRVAARAAEVFNVETVELPKGARSTTHEVSENGRPGWAEGKTDLAGIDLHNP